MRESRDRQKKEGEVGLVEEEDGGTEDGRN